MVVAGSPDPRQHPFGSGQSSLSGRLSGPLLAEEPAPRSPVSRCLSATGIRFSDHPAPAGGSAFLTVGPPDAHAPGPRRGCHVPHQTATTGLGALCTPGTVVRSRPTKFARAAPVASQRPAPTSRWNIPPSESADDEASTRVHAIHPSGLPQPVTTGWNGGPWALPRASHPAVTRDARRGGDGPCALDRTLRLRHQPNLLRRESLPACDFRVAPPG